MTVEVSKDGADLVVARRKLEKIRVRLGSLRKILRHSDSAAISNTLYSDAVNAVQEILDEEL